MNKTDIHNHREVRDVLKPRLEADFFTGDVKEIAKKLNNIKKFFKFDDEYFNKKLHKNSYYKFEISPIAVDNYDYSADIEFEVYGIRLETDEEADKRVKRYEKAKKASEINAKKKKAAEAQKKRELYEQLKAEFENINNYE